MPRNIRSRDPVYVAIGSGANTINYGFNTGLATADRDNFGQVAIDATALPTKLVFGANSPKPAKASKKGATGTISSFCSDANRAALKAVGYTISRPKARWSTKNAFYVTINGVKYGWKPGPMPAYVTADVLTALGVKTATVADRDELVFGASYPKPARVKTILGVAPNENSFSTFVDPTNEDGLPDTYTFIEAARTTF